jgi:hypothetical protein
MDKYQEYLRNADVCVRLSKKTSNDEFKASWLKLAQAWLEMVPTQEPVVLTFKAAA